MMPSLMPVTQQSVVPAETLPAGTARRVMPAAVDRWLWVAHGRIWITGVPTEARGADLWLSAGEAVRLPAGSDAVLESGSRHDSAAFVLAEATADAGRRPVAITPLRQALASRLLGWARAVAGAPLLSAEGAR